MFLSIITFREAILVQKAGSVAWSSRTYIDPGIFDRCVFCVCDIP